MKLTVKEVAGEIGETSAVIRNWIRDFKTLIPTEKGDNGYNLFPPDAVEVLRTIKRLHRDQGYSTRQIEHHLATGDEISVAKAIEHVAPSELSEMREMMQRILDNQAKEEDFKRELVQRLDHREKRFDEFITEQREQRKLLLGSADKPKRKISFWQRIKGGK